MSPCKYHTSRAVIPFLIKFDRPPYASLWPQVAEFNRRVSGAKSNREQKPTSTRPQLTSNTGEDDDWRPLNVDQEIDDVEPRPSTTSPTVHERLEQVKRHLKRNKENLRHTQNPGPSSAPHTFVDPEANAQRVQLSQGTQFGGRSAPRSSQIGRGKRPGPASDEDVGQVSEDEGFERNQRTVDVQRKRKEAPTSSLRSVIVDSPKRARLQAIAEELHDSEEEDDLDNHNVISQVPSSNYREVNEISKKLSLLKRRKRQNPTRWSPLEEDRLISLIEEVGSSWAQIKRVDENSGNILALRDQVALKDKARNMKYDYLKVGDQLPENFEGVALNARQKAKLKELGIQNV